jgi:alpha-mannosidase
MGGNARVKLSLADSVKAYAPCNLLENYNEVTEGNDLCVSFRPFEIKCFRIFFR